MVDHHLCLSISLCMQLGGWAVSGQWNRTDFNSTLSLLMRDYATFPFFNLYAGKDPNEIPRETAKRYIQASLHWSNLSLDRLERARPSQSRLHLIALTSSLLSVNRSISQIC